MIGAGIISSDSSKPWEEPEQILIVRLGSMGDIIHTLPAVGALRKTFSNTRIGWVVEERWLELLCTPTCARAGARSPQRPLVDRLHVLNTKAWRKSWRSAETWHQIAVAISHLRAPRYPLAIDFQGAVRSALIARRSGAEIIYGAVHPRENVASMFYSREVFTEGAHVVEQNMSLAEAVAHRKLDLCSVEFPHDPVAERKCEEQLRQWAIHGFALLNPGAGWGAKQWPAERYGQVAQGLAQHGIASLINFGPGEETLAKAAEAAAGGAARPLCCSISELIAFTRRARLFIGGDTGPLHLAAAMQVPVVAIFGPTNPLRNGPYGTRSIVLRRPSSKTSHARRVEPDAGLLEITSSEVVHAARGLLRINHG
jgi:heptosyltransferase-1